MSNAEEVAFRFVVAATGLTRGNLSRQGGKLEEARYIAVCRHYKGETPATSYTMTPEGRAAFTSYWVRMSELQRHSRSERD